LPAHHNDGIAPTVESTSPAARRNALVRLAGQFAAFAAVGLPVFAVAAGLNVVLVEWAHWPKWLAYALVQATQVLIGFLLLDNVIFRGKKERPGGSRLLQWTATSATLRAVDWLLYNALVAFLPAWYLAIQFGNAVLLNLVRFGAARRVFRRREGVRTPPSGTSGAGGCGSGSRRG
jgi:putative flippase GtrA